MGACLNSLKQFDRNFDGQITISDFFGTIKAFANLPAEIAIDSIEGSETYRFLELSQDSCTSNTSLFLSLVIWGILWYFFAQHTGDTDERARQEYEAKKRDMGY